MHESIEYLKELRTLLNLPNPPVFACAARRDVVLERTSADVAALEVEMREASQHV